MHDADDPATNKVLSGARRGWSPSANDAERVRGRIEAALAAGVSAPPPRASGAPAWVGRVLLTAAFTAAGAGAGYWAGRRTARPAIPIASTPGSSSSLPSPGRSPSPAPSVEPPAVIPSPAQAPRRAERTRHASVATPPAESLAVEVRALRNVERALRDRNAGLASAFLDDLDRAVPGGQMREERAALRAIASCMTGAQPFGVDAAEDFGAAYPGSAYRARVDQACTRTDSASAGDSSARR